MLKQQYLRFHNSPSADFWVAVWLLGSSCDVNFSLININGFWNGYRFKCAQYYTACLFEAFYQQITYCQWTPLLSNSKLFISFKAFWDRKKKCYLRKPVSTRSQKASCIAKTINKYLLSSTCTYTYQITNQSLVHVVISKLPCIDTSLYVKTIKKYIYSHIIIDTLTFNISSILLSVITSQSVAAGIRNCFPLVPNPATRQTTTSNKTAEKLNYYSAQCI